jgi:GTP:adenosylcobinamide-phosphate guanylyltransferase
MATIGILPASGRASRIGGIPKFCLPISDERSLLQWHVEQMLEVCDEVRVSTRSEWVPIIQNMDMNIKLIVHEPSTMSDAVKFMVGDYNDTVLVGMPDTFVLNASGNIYKEMFKETNADLVLGVWECTDELKGRVGQVLLSEDRVIGSEDKTDNCDYKDMWGSMMFRKNMVRYLDPTLEHPGKQIKDWILDGRNIRAVRPGGKYMDIGTLKGLKQLYKEMDFPLTNQS